MSFHSVLLIAFFFLRSQAQNDPNDQSFPSIIGKTPALSEYLCWQLTSEDNVRSYFLNFLNGLRQGLIYQDVSCGGRRKCRSPQNYYELAYDCRLEAYAQKIVDSCGTNLTEVEGTSFIASVKESATSCDVMPMLLEEFQIGWDNVTTSSVNYRNPTFNSEDVRQFAVIANGKATRVGCAQKFCGDENNLHTACYFNAPMKLNDPIYTPGEACSVDADCTMLLESKCNATTSFCYGGHPESIPVPTTTTTTTTTRKPVASLCPNSNILTEDVRNTIVDTHNSLRSQLANGQVYNIWTHKNVDQASRMLTMKYNCTAEANAYKWASQCLNKQSPQKERPQFKESRYFSSRRSYTQMDAAKRAMTQWWNEINQIGLPADNLFYFTRNITSFAKMAWDHTDQIGCAYATCGKGFHFVCQYGIGGTVEGKVIYNKGPPCSTCGAGRQCSKGLCMSP